MFKLLVLCSVVSMVLADGIRVEYRLSNFKNPGGILASGRKCDRGLNKKCDPVISASIDTDSPSAPWPGSKPVRQWTKVFEADEMDSAAVNKIVSKDMCSSRSPFTRANLRVNVVDNDGTKSAPIEQFECLLSASARDLPNRETDAQWSAEKSCTAKNNPDRVKLMYSWRAFRINDRDCGRPVIGERPRPSYGRRTALDA